MSSYGKTVFGPWLLPLAASLALGLAACNDDNVAVAPAPGFTVDASGGLGGSNGGTGGAGDDFDIFLEGGIGNLDVLNNGLVKAGFTKSSPAAFLGANPLDIAADTTIAVVAVEPAAGVAYMVAADNNVYVSDGDVAIQDETPVTGIHVANGVTLTLGLNQSAATIARVALANDLHNQGTITTLDASPTQRGHLDLYVDSYIAASELDTSGSLDGQSGGHVNFNISNSIYNHGMINTAGAAGVAGAGGNGGYVNMWGERTENTGDITTNGGNATAGAGGNAGYIYLGSWWAEMFNSGNMNANGGNGTTGGAADYIQLEADLGDMRNSGDLSSSGGNGATGSGGNGDYTYLYAYGGSLLHNGMITTTGGDTSAAAGNGGSGGNVWMEANTASFYEWQPSGDLLVSGDIDSSGGNATAGGTGNGGGAGYVDAYLYTDGWALDQRLAFLGYDSVNTSGGDGNQGGVADYMDLFHDYDWSDPGEIYLSGSVVNEADLIAHGGNVVPGATVLPANGGDGWYINLETTYWLGGIIDVTTINRGDIDMSGGNSHESLNNTVGEAGSLWMWGYHGVTNSGDVTSRGGDDTGTDGGVTGFGNRGDDIEIYADLGPVNNSGDLTTDGGNGEYDGGDAQWIELFGATVKNSGALSANGGNADITLAGSTGGNGWYIELYSPGGVAGVSNSGATSVSGGTGTTAGTDSYIVEGGLCIAGTC